MADTRTSALQPKTLDPTRAELAALELQVAARERELAATKIELRDLQARYLSELGALYEQLSALEAAVAEEEIRAGIRPPDLFDDDDDETAEAATTEGSNRSAPSGNLKKMFRDVARAVHPDRAMDDRARFRRHSLMAEANRAYAERDEDRLRLILRAWEHSGDATIDDDGATMETRIRRRLALLGDRLVTIDAELGELHGSAIARLKRRIDETKTQGWDLFGEMLRHVNREIARASARLEKQRRARKAV